MHVLSKHSTTPCKTITEDHFQEVQGEWCSANPCPRVLNNFRQRCGSMFADFGEYVRIVQKEDKSSGGALTRFNLIQQSQRENTSAEYSF